MTQDRRERVLLERIRREWKAVKEAEQALNEAGRVYQERKERFRDAMHRVRQSEALLSAELQGIDTGQAESRQQTTDSSEKKRNTT